MSLTRRAPEESEREILDAARRFLHERPLRDLTVRRLMEATRLERPSFYVYFTSKYDLLRRLLGDLQAELMAAWLADPAAFSPASGPSGLAEALRRVVAFWEEHGPILSAFHEGSFQDGELEQLYRTGFTGNLVETVAEQIGASADGQTGQGIPDAGEVAAALVVMTESYLMDRLGRSPRSSPQTAHRTLTRIWTAALGAPPRG